MFATVHKKGLFTFLLCALFFTSAQPMVARSQEEVLPPRGEVLVATTTPENVPSTPVAEVSVSYANLYPVEGIPGSGAVGDFVVGPGKIDLTLKPGQSKVVEMTVTNRTGDTRLFTLLTEDAMGSHDPYTSIVLLGDDRGPYSLKDYLTVPHEKFEIKHNERARIPVTISLPENAEPGGLYGSVLVSTTAVEPKDDETDATVPQSAIIARVGTLFFITVPGDVARDGALKDFGTLAKKSFYQQGPIDFGILFENTGSMHLAPYGELRITNMFGEEVGYLTLEPWFVMPQSLRLREVSWNRDMLFGRYTATVSVNRSYDDIIDTMSYSFWVLPWKPVTGAFGALFITLFLIRAFFKRFEFKRK